MNPNEQDTDRLFIPTPIPESQAFHWDELLAPTQSALRELLTWLKAACDTSTLTQEDEHLSTSLLLSGARGSGKTTVLLSAALALKKWSTFFFGRERPEIPPEADNLHRDLAGMLQELKDHIVWLDPLDLEPLPARANLLATLLVRVRAALDDPLSSGSSRRQGSWAPSSLLEESAEDTWEKLDHLVRDASFMWEDFPSVTDARGRADQQIKASQIYADFQRRFGKTMEDVTRMLSLRQFGPSARGQIILVLPIDNVDRSIDHLYNIVKLTRMVTSRRLWFILAAGHEEFQLFMERSFQKELSISGEPFTGPSRDETLTIARRQAATTLRRTLPPNYRLEIGLVPPELAWTYPYHLGQRGTGSSSGDRPLCELLRELRLPDCPARGHKLARFSDLFELSARFKPSVEQALQALLRERAAGARNPSDAKTVGEPLFTDAARQALTLPARTLQDLWHAAYREVNSSAVDDGEKAVRVATEMLRNAIDESGLPAWASQQLHNRIIRRDAQGRIVLDLTGKPVSRAKRTSLSDVMEWPRQKEDLTGRAVLLSELHLRRFHDVILMLEDLDTPGKRVPMSGSVAGWFMLLHDVLMLFPEPRVLNVEMTAFEMSPELVVTLHELSVEHPEAEPSEPFIQLVFLWTLPTWDTFIDFAIFTAQWKAFLYKWNGLFSFHPDPRRVEFLFRFVLAAWVDNVCSVAGLNRGMWTLPSELSSTLGKAEGGEEELEAYERSVQDAINVLLHSIEEESNGYDRLWMARAWLEQFLLLLALPEFSPGPPHCALLDWAERSDLHWNDLMGHWEQHVHRLKRTRQRLVRSVAMSSNAYEALRKAHGADQGAAVGALQRWLTQVDHTWFQAVDGNSRERTPAVLREVTPHPPLPSTEERRADHP